MAELKKRFPETKILPAKSPAARRQRPSSGAQVVAINQLLPKLADGHQVVYLDIWKKFLNSQGEVPPEIMPDLLHPNLPGYEIFAAAIREPLRSPGKMKP